LVLSQRLWDQLSAERNRYLDGVDVDLSRRSAGKAASQDRQSKASLGDREWLDNPDAKAETVVAECLEELRGGDPSA
jgi:hypothetical protein